MPDSVLQGAVKSGGRRRRRGRKQIEEARQHLAGLLEAARAVDLKGWAETELGELADIAQRGLPAGHTLVLAESVADASHPLVGTISAAGRYTAVGRVEAAKGGGWEGLDLLAAELSQETGVTIAAAALQELARRTIQRRETRGAAGQVSAESTSRFAAEFRKLATLTGAGEIGVQLVENVVEDRGEEDAWKILDAVGAGHAEEALQRIRRLLAAAEDPLAARLSFFALLAGFARQLTVLCSLADELEIPRRALSYPNFKNQIAPRLQADLANGSPSPVAGLHPYRLYRAFTVASRFPARSSGICLPRSWRPNCASKGRVASPTSRCRALSAIWHLWPAVRAENRSSMPELPEVEVLRRSLEPHVVGATIESVRVWNPDLREPVNRRRSAPAEVGRSVAARRRAKYLLLDLTGGKTMVVHLGMSGRLTLALSSALPEPHEHVSIFLDSGRRLRFRDTRRFGLVLVRSTRESGGRLPFCPSGARATGGCPRR